MINLKFYKLCNLLLIGFLLVLIHLTLAVAQQYYADVEIIVDETGFVTIQGITNHPELLDVQTQELTSKDGKNWILNISINDTFSNFIYAIKLPRYSTINYLLTTDVSRFEHTQDSLGIIGTGKNKTFTIIVQYSIEKNEQVSSDNTSFMLGIVIILFIILIISLYLIKTYNLFRSKKKTRKIKVLSDSSNSGIFTSYDLLTNRQKEIIDILKAHGGSLSQKALQDNVSMPKSSLSRNIDSLVRKGFIKKYPKGVSNIISLIVSESST